MEIAYFKREQRKGIFNYYKVFGGAGKTKNGYQEVVNFLNDKPIISVEHNLPYDPAHPDKPFELIGTWDTYEVGMPILEDEYNMAYKKATSQDFKVL